MPQPPPPFEIVQCLTGPHASRVGLRYYHDVPSSITGGTVIFADDHPDEGRSRGHGSGNTEYRVIISTSDLLALINSIVQELPPVAPPDTPPVAPPDRPTTTPDIPHAWQCVTIPTDSPPETQPILASIPPRPMAVYNDSNADSIDDRRAFGPAYQRLLDAMIRSTINP